MRYYISFPDVLLLRKEGTIILTGRILEYCVENTLQLGSLYSLHVHFLSVEIPYLGKECSEVLHVLDLYKYKKNSALYDYKVIIALYFLLMTSRIIVKTGTV